MAHLEELTRGTVVKGILPDSLVTVIDVKWYGSSAIELTYKDASGRLGHELLYRDREPTLEIASAGRPWGFNADGALFKLVSEAYRIRLAHLFDPLLAVHTSLVEPLPHQITAVYGEMLTRQPLRFLLADDPGAGKTIMTGLLIKELLIRGDLHRCLIVCPGMLVEQWQDELDGRFHLPFEILTNDKLESARTGNWFLENPLAICRRITFEKTLISIPGKPLAAFVCPGHPLLDATIDLILERYRDLLKQGAILVDPNVPQGEVRALFYLEHAIQDARTDRSGHRRTVSRQMHFVEIDRQGTVQKAGYAPYLDYRPLTEEERLLVEPILEETWLRWDLEDQVLPYAISDLVPRSKRARGRSENGDNHKKRDSYRPQ